jgi:hypothetical protein
VRRHRLPRSSSVAAGVVVGEQLVERPTHGLGEDHRARHERHAEDHGETGEEEAQLVRPEALEGEREHVSMMRRSGRGVVRRPTLSSVARLNRQTDGAVTLGT